MQQQIVVNVLLDGERRIQKTLDLRFAVIEFVLGNALGVNTNFVDHAAGSALEVRVILEKVGMAENMCGHKGILEEIIHIHQEGVARIGVDHHLIDFAQPEVILHFLPVISFTVRPVAETTRQTIGGKLVHDGRGHQFKVCRKRIKSKLESLIPGTIYCISQSFDLTICHTTGSFQGRDQEFSVSSLTNSSQFSLILRYKFSMWGCSPHFIY